MTLRTYTMKFTADELDPLNTALNKACVAWNDQIKDEPDHENAQVRRNFWNETGHLWCRVHVAQREFALRPEATDVV